MKKQTYIYSSFERFWHWSQALLIFFLMLTGFEIHSSFELFGYENAVNWHNIASWTFLVLIIFAIFWHFTTGEWKQYRPSLKLVKEQFQYYVSGIFKGSPHPTHKTRYTKFNPLQRLIYLGLKLLVIPIQVITGFIYLSYLNPEHSITEGGLRTIAVFHTIGAFSLIAFVIAHIYLTTTGEKILTSIKAMITGWEVVDIDKKEEYLTNMRKAVENSTAGYYRINTEGKFVQVNNAWLLLYGYSNESEILGQHFSVTRTEDKVKDLKNIFDKVLTGKKVLAKHVVRKNKDGSLGYHILSANPIFENEKVIGMEGFIVDISSIEIDTLQMYNTVRSSSAGYYRINKDGYFEDVNDAWLKMYKCEDKNQVIGKHYSLSRKEEDMKELEEIVKHVMTGDIISGRIATRKCKDESQGKHLLSANPIYKKGEIVGMEGFIIDITE